MRDLKGRPLCGKFSLSRTAGAKLMCSHQVSSEALMSYVLLNTKLGMGSDWKSTDS